MSRWSPKNAPPGTELCSIVPVCGFKRFRAKGPTIYIAWAIGPGL
jgi:hypothetical protein